VTRPRRLRRVSFTVAMRVPSKHICLSRSIVCQLYFCFFLQSRVSPFGFSVYTSVADPDPTFFHPGSRIRTVSIPDPGSSSKYFNPQKSQKKWFLSFKKYDPDPQYWFILIIMFSPCAGPESTGFVCYWDTVPVFC
jgi:hypothetical protein